MGTTQQSSQLKMKSLIVAQSVEVGEKQIISIKNTITENQKIVISQAKCDLACMLHSKASSQYPIADFSMPGKPCTTILGAAYIWIVRHLSLINIWELSNSHAYFYTCAWLLAEL